MSVAENEITEQFAGFGDREPFVLPQANENIKLERYLFTAANLISPKIARERPHMASGGLNVYNPCLNQSMDFIRRGRITPLLTNQHIPIPAEEANTENSDYFSIPAGGDSFRGHEPLPGDSAGMMGRAAYPGQQIMHILEGSYNVDGSGQRLGIVELTTLKGHKYALSRIGGFQTDPELWKINCAIFPDYPILPIQITPFKELIQRAIDNNVGDVRSVAEEALPSCGEFELWAIRHMEIVHQNMEFASSNRYALPYEDVDLIILDQLGMKRQDRHYRQMAQQAPAQQQLDPASLIAMVREAGAQDREMFMAGMSQLIQEWKNDSKPINEDTMKEKPLHWKTREKMEKEAAAQATESEE